MPIRLDDQLPAYKILKNNGVFVMDEDRAKSQDIRPIKIGILNLMPNKQETEAQLLQMIGETPLQVEPILIKTASYTSKNTSANHLEQFYVEFGEIKAEGLDGLIITGAPVERLEFEKVAYWQELVEIMDWARVHVASTLFLCWAAQASLYHHFAIGKHQLAEKRLGVFLHDVLINDDPLTRSLDDEYWVPHGRNTETKLEDIINLEELDLLVSSDVAGAHLVANKDRSMVFQFGHPEYSPNTLKQEYSRDKDRASYKLSLPENYFTDNDETKRPRVRWRANAAIFYRNWVNHVYQSTPYNLKTREFNQS